MPQLQALTDEQAQEIASRLLPALLSSAGYDHVTVRSGPDHDGDPALFLDVTLKPGSPEMDAETFSRAQGAVDDAFRDQGETRFPYFSVIWPDEFIEDFDLAS